MKLKASDAVAARARSPTNWFLGICLAAFLTISASAATDAQTGVEGLSPAEQWVVERVTAGQEANLATALNADRTKKFAEEKDRKLNAHFLQDLLMGTLPGVKVHRNGVRITGAIIDEPIDLTNAQIPCEVWLAHCQFNKSATLHRASFAGLVLFDGSAFKADANFNSMKVGGTIFFRNAVFEGSVNFGFADIAGDLDAPGAKFQNKEKEANFNSMKVGHAAFFKNAVFEGPVNFGSTNIASEFGAQGAKFQNKEKEANFDSMKVGASAFVTNAVFEGPVNFRYADIISNFNAQGAKFQNKEKLANFNGMKVAGQALLHNAVFEGPVAFIRADFTGNFQADEAKFQNKEKGATFSGIRVGGFALFMKAVFQGPVDFGYTDFAVLDLSSCVWPKVARQFRMEGMTYKYIRAIRENEPESHKVLLTLAKQSAYTADVYSKLEDFFLRQGYRADADKAFIAGKRREREEYFRSGHWFGWLGSWMLDLLVGYGRRPWQAGIPCAALVALGCVLFSPKKMEPQRPEDTPRVYSRFWYSLGLFLPFVDLQADKVWKPKADQTFLRNYMRVHVLLGWILVPLVLAAVTGLIK